MTGLLPTAAGTSLLCDLELLPSPLPALPNKENQHHDPLKSFLLAIDGASPFYFRSTLFRPILVLAWPVQYGSKDRGHEDSRDQVRLPLNGGGTPMNATLNGNTRVSHSASPAS